MTYSFAISSSIFFCFFRDFCPQAWVRQHSEVPPEHTRCSGKIPPTMPRHLFYSPVTPISLLFGVRLLPTNPPFARGTRTVLPLNSYFAFHDLDGFLVLWENSKARSAFMTTIAVSPQPTQPRGVLGWTCKRKVASGVPPPTHNRRSPSSHQLEIRMRGDFHMLTGAALPYRWSALGAGP